MKSKKIAVTCVLWQGNFRGRNYTEEWVHKLEKMTRRNLSVPFDFICFSNTGLGLPLEQNWPGWWAKMEQFSRKEIMQYDLVLGFDLDLLITQSIDALLWDVDICFAPQTEKTMAKKKGKKRVQKYRTGAFVYKPQKMFKYGLKFKKDAAKSIKKYRGDQDWWGAHCPNAHTFPAKWFCKTKHIKTKPDSEVKIVFGNHIKNDEAVKKWGWAKQIWT